MQFLGTLGINDYSGWGEDYEQKALDTMLGEGYKTLPRLSKLPLLNNIFKSIHIRYYPETIDIYGIKYNKHKTIENPPSKTSYDNLPVYYIYYIRQGVENLFEGKKIYTDNRPDEKERNKLQDPNYILIKIYGATRSIQNRLLAFEYFDKEIEIKSPEKLTDRDSPETGYLGKGLAELNKYSRH
jgi:hypothetical protein